MISLREYQKDFIEDIRQSFKKGNKKILSVLPCGAGKTVCFSYMAQEHTKQDKNNFVWFLVHRRELLQQTIETFKKFDLPMNNIYIGTIQSRIRPIKSPTLIIFDEAHHATAGTWQTLIESYPNIPIVGLTATPIRTDNKPLGNIFEDLIVGVNSDYLIKNNFLAPYDYYAPNIVNFIDTNMRGNDFDMNDVTEYLFKSKIVGNIDKCIDLDKKTIIYAPSIKFSKYLEELYEGDLVHFDGTTPKEERDEIIRKFRNGEIRVLSNVDLIGEGFDVPDCDTIILLRPTMSLSLYIQQSMRALRYQPNKRAKIYDLVGNVYRHNLPTIDRTYSLIENNIKKESQKVLLRECKNCFRVYQGLNRFCSHCNFDNGKDQREIEMEKERELELIKELKVNERKSTNKFNDLVLIGKQRGYKNPYFWAKMVMKGRAKK
jgi:superfamily II DNA or RNA helicase